MSTAFLSSSTLLSIIFKLRRRREARSKRIARYPAEQRTRWAEYYYSAATTAAANSSSPASSSAPEGTCPSPESETSPLSASSTRHPPLLYRRRPLHDRRRSSPNPQRPPPWTAAKI